MKLTEVVIAVAIVLIVSVSVGIFLMGHYGDAKLSREAENYNALKTAFFSYVTKHGSFPADTNSDTDLYDELVRAGAISPNVKSVYSCVKWFIREAIDVNNRRAYYIDIDMKSCPESAISEILTFYAKLDEKIDDGNPLSGIIRVND